MSEKLWTFNHKRADFWLPNSGFKRSLLSLLKVFHTTEYVALGGWGREVTVDYKLQGDAYLENFVDLSLEKLLGKDLTVLENQ